MKEADTMIEPTNESRPETSQPVPPHDAALSAGGMLRAARERQGVHIAVLAAAIKVSPRKLDALEGDRYDELPDATFTRALAQTVCRALKIDAQPVLAKLPQGLANVALEQVNSGLNTPFRERPGRTELASSLASRPLMWGGVALLLSAAVIAMWPAQGWKWPFGGGSAGTSAPAVVTPEPATAAMPAVADPVSVATAASQPSAAASAVAASPIVETVHSAPPADASSSRGATITANDQSWVEITDAGGRTLISRVIQPGEAVHLEGALPMRLKIGNAKATQLVFRGQPIDLDGFTRENVARVELK
jgi:cytoskeleton protein RodZ